MERSAPSGWASKPRGRARDTPCLQPGTPEHVAQSPAGNAARAVPTGSLVRVGPLAPPGHWDHTWQNINYCCFQDPPVTAVAGPAQEVQIIANASILVTPHRESGHLTPQRLLGNLRQSPVCPGTCL